MKRKHVEAMREANLREASRADCGLPLVVAVRYRGERGGFVCTAERTGPGYVPQCKWGQRGRRRKRKTRLGCRFHRDFRLFGLLHSGEIGPEKMRSWRRQAS